MPNKNQIYIVNITDINNLGFGVCRIDGVVTFVSGTVTEDVAEVKVIKVTKSYCVGRLERLITPSRLRTEPECPAFASCGGCVYSHINYAEEKKLKRQYVEVEFKKAGLPDVTVNEVCAPSGTKHYRNKVQYPVAPDYTYGYYAPKSHKIVKSPGCALHPRIFDEISEQACFFFKEKNITVYNEETHTGLIRHIYLRAGFKSGDIMLCLVINGDALPHSDEFTSFITQKFPEIKTVVLSINTEKTNIILGKEIKTLYGNGSITDTLLGNIYNISPLSFYQINPVTAEAIYKKAIDLAEIKEGDKICDLYCGIGTIALSATKMSQAKSVIGVEIIPDAVENAKQNARANGIVNAEFYCGDANDPHIDGSDVIFVDPPRKGLSAELIRHIAEVAPRRVVYISCAADTLARDCALFEKQGYTVNEVYPYDMFPRTGHIENVCVLKRKDII